MPDVSYTRRQLARVLHLRPAQLSRWQRLELFPRRRRYGWAELLRARALGKLEAATISGRRLRGSVHAVCQRLPEMSDPLLEAGWSLVAGRVEVIFRGVRMDALSGQLRLPFAPVEQPRRPAEDPEQNPEKWFLMGLALEGEPELREQAAAAYERCLALDPNYSSAYINLGTLRYHQKDYAAAEQCYRAALELDPNYALAYFNLGNVLDETGRLPQAIDAYCEAIRLAPGYADAHYNLALAYQRTGERRRAVPHWRQYLGLDGKSPWAVHARGQLKQTIAIDGLKLVGKTS